MWYSECLPSCRFWWLEIYNRPMKVYVRAIASALFIILGSLAPLFGQAPAQQQPPEFVKQASS
jgi:hypothetical protein